MYKCKNAECSRTFCIPGRISTEKAPADVHNFTARRIVVEKPCCPFCESIEFEEVQK